MENYLTVAQAAKLLPGRPHVATVWRYCLYGVNGRKLASVKVGGKRFVSIEAIEEFVLGEAVPHSQLSRSAKRKQLDVENELKEMGVL